MVKGVLGHWERSTGFPLLLHHFSKCWWPLRNWNFINPALGENRDRADFKQRRSHRSNHAKEKKHGTKIFLNCSLQRPQERGYLGSTQWAWSWLRGIKPQDYRIWQMQRIRRLKEALQFNSVTWISLDSHRLQVSPGLYTVLHPLYC